MKLFVIDSTNPNDLTLSISVCFILIRFSFYVRLASDNFGRPWRDRLYREYVATTSISTVTSSSEIIGSLLSSRPDDNATTDKTWKSLTSAETGRRHRHSGSATVEGAGSLRHFHHGVRWAARGRHIGGDGRTGGGGGRRHRRDGYTGDGYTVRARVPGRIRATAAVIGTVRTGARFAADSVAVRARITVDVARTVVARRATAAAHGGDTDHPFPRDILDRTGRSGADPRGLENRILLGGVGAGDGGQAAVRALAGRHGTRGHVVSRHMMAVLFRGFELHQRRRVFVFSRGRDTGHGLRRRHRRPRRRVAHEGGGSRVWTDRRDRRGGYWH